MLVGLKGGVKGFSTGRANLLLSLEKKERRRVVFIACFSIHVIQGVVIRESLCSLSKNSYDTG